ncbi:MAG: S1C family serine protease [Planctomycetota bacterium]|nr:trypsin-like peptidase domain-containing protein [Planctomycetaceae bacterium]MDQ3329165.1 S1C family serine protease [Planctomycetota bacterium]
MRLILQVLLLAAVTACLPHVSHAAENDSQATLAEALPKLVKLYGAGGFRGLEGYGTGFLASPDGHVVTSWGPLLDADRPVAVLGDGRRVEAKLVGADSASGLAVLKLDGPGAPFPHFDLAEAVDLAPGDRIFALSNMFRVAAGDEPVSVMHGMILAKAPLSARRGRFETSLDAPVYFLDSVTNNPGAAGGVIISLDGRIGGMIGRELRGESTETWINYAVPATVIAERIGLVIAGDEIAKPNPADADAPDNARRPIEVGLVMIPDVTARTPAFVSDVLDDSVAISAGFKRDDLILFGNGAPIRSIRELTTLLSRAERGDEIAVIVRRDGGLVTLTFLIP